MIIKISDLKCKCFSCTNSRKLMRLYYIYLTWRLYCISIKNVKYYLLRLWAVLCICLYHLSISPSLTATTSSMGSILHPKATLHKSLLFPATRHSWPAVISKHKCGAPEGWAETQAVLDLISQTRNQICLAIVRTVWNEDCWHDYKAAYFYLRTRMTSCVT